MINTDDGANKIFAAIKQLDSPDIRISDRGGALKINYRNRLEADLYLSVNSGTGACKIMLYVASFVFDGKTYCPPGIYAGIRRGPDRLSELPEAVKSEIAGLYGKLESSFEKALVFIQNIINIPDRDFRDDVMTASRLLLSGQI